MNREKYFVSPKVLLLAAGLMLAGCGLKLKPDPAIITSSPADVGLRAGSNGYLVGEPGQKAGDVVGDIFAPDLAGRSPTVLDKIAAAGKPTEDGSSDPDRAVRQQVRARAENNDQVGVIITNTPVHILAVTTTGSGNTYCKVQVTSGDHAFFQKPPTDTGWVARKIIRAKPFTRPVPR